MPKIKYRDFSFRFASLALIDKANEIIEDCQSQSFDLTLRHKRRHQFKIDLICLAGLAVMLGIVLRGLLVCWLAK